MNLYEENTMNQKVSSNLQKMETPVLSKSQKKRSLSGKKSKKETIKNVVVDPYQNYWPLVQSELEQLTNTLKDNLPRVRPLKINVPWRLLQDIPKGDRKIVRDNYIGKHSSGEKFTKSEFLMFGVNEVTKFLEIDACSIVLIADVKPRMVVKHIVEMAVLKSVPVLVVSTLKQILKDSCGLESMAFAIKKSVPDTSTLARIVNTVVEISKNYPPSANHINLTRSNIFQDKNEKTQYNLNKPAEIKNEVKPLNYHLMRTSPNQRVFELSENEKDIVLTKVNTYENIHSAANELHYDKLNEALGKKKMKKLYKALVVKRLKGNKNRHKDKVK